VVPSLSSAMPCAWSTPALPGLDRPVSGDDAAEESLTDLRWSMCHPSQFQRRASLFGWPEAAWMATALVAAAASRVEAG
jgi:hypothetical protein